MLKCDKYLYKSAVKALQVQFSFTDILHFSYLIYTHFLSGISNYKAAPCLLSDNMFYFSQQLVDGTRRLSSSEQNREIYVELSTLFSSKIINLSCPSFERCSKKDARKNMKVLASHSVYLLSTVTDYFLDSSPEKRSHLKVCHLIFLIIIS